jgi:hypothetical protein
MGRFLSADPFVPDPFDGQSFNRYSYVRNNPLTRTDPTGFNDVTELPPPVFGPQAPDPNNNGGGFRFGCSCIAPNLYGTGAFTYTNTYIAAYMETSGRSPEPSETNSEVARYDQIVAQQPQREQPIVIRSPEWLRAVVPGQIAWDDARTAWANDNYGWALANTGAMLAEQVLVVATLGAASTYTQGARTAGSVVAGDTPIVIGENMARVKEYAARVGGDIFTGRGKAANRAWAQAARDAGRRVIDIGPDFKRRLDRVLNSERADSIYYNLERQVMKGYENVQKVWERAGKFWGELTGGS